VTETTDWFDGTASDWIEISLPKYPMVHTAGIAREDTAPARGTAGTFPEVPGFVSNPGDPDVDPWTLTSYPTQLAFVVAMSEFPWLYDPSSVQFKTVMLEVNFDTDAIAESDPGPVADMGNVPGTWNLEYVSVEYEALTSEATDVKLTGVISAGDTPDRRSTSGRLYYQDGYALPQTSGARSYPGDIWRAWSSIYVSDSATQAVDIAATIGQAMTLIVVDEGSENEWTSSPITDTSVSPGYTTTAGLSTVKGWAKFQRARYRFVYDPPAIVGFPPLRRRQNRAGNGGGPAMRHRQNGGNNGGPLSRQRQTGL